MADTPANGVRPPSGVRPPDGPGATPSSSADPGSGDRGATPIPELTSVSDVADVLRTFGGIDVAPSPARTHGISETTAPPTTPPPTTPPPTTSAHGTVTDDDRNRYGMLLDHAAERGLLDQHEYEARLGDLASATSIDQMQRIVTELPILNSPLTALPSSKGRRSGASSPGGAGSTGTTGGGRRSSPWLVLVVMVVVLVAALVFFAVYAGHIAHTRGTGAGPPPWSVTRSAGSS